ncbi:flagellar basal body rod protein FlgF [Legionella nagasakiensis]|uniref:flagellar basal body rod protein FlgF n=1 Tax=Legionella nagasakiensis TaxID=535290 RepID=UPI0013EFAA5B|nr:flagellar basal body rod protein FlgF [Legionella nagasakiensis]
MVNHALYVDLAGTKQAMRSMRMTVNNLANTNTIGFQADYETQIPVPTSTKDKMQTRVHVASNQSYSDFTQGPIIATGRALDIAIDGPGFIAVQTKDGEEAYTRAGNLQITPDGIVVTSKGDLVLSSRGVINVPRGSRVTISERAEVSAKLPEEAENQVLQLGQLKLVKLPIDQIYKGPDGLFRLKEDANVDLTSQDPINVIPRSLEGSNVNPVRALTELIDISRNFEMHTKLMKTVEENATVANQLLNISK